MEAIAEPKTNGVLAVDPASFDEIQRDVYADPSCVRDVDFVGHRPFCLTVYGLELAKAEGHDVLQTVADLLTTVFAGRSQEEVEAVELTDTASVLALLRPALSLETMHGLCLVLWAGFLPFDRGLSLERVKANASPGRLALALKAVLPKMLAFAGEMGLADAVKARAAGTVGKPKAKRSKGSKRG